VFEEVTVPASQDRGTPSSRESASSALAAPNNRQAEQYQYDETDKLIAKTDKSGQLIKFGYDLASYHPKEIDFTGEGLKVGLTYKEFEQDEKTAHKPQVIKGDFGELRLSYTGQGQFRESDDDALMDVFAAALGAQSHAALVEMLSYKGKEIPTPDDCVKGKEQPEEDRTSPPDEVMDAWARLSAIFDLLSSVDKELPKDTRFTRFLSRFDSDLLTDSAFTKFLGNFSADILVDQNFTSGLVAANKSILKDVRYRNEMTQYDSDFLKSDELSWLLSNSEPKFSDTGKLLKLIPTDPDTSGERVESIARRAVNLLILPHLRTNPDLQRIVDLYFEASAPIRVQEISPGGFSDDNVTISALRTLINRIKDDVVYIPEVAQTIRSGATSLNLVTTLGIISNSLNLGDFLNVVGDTDPNAEETVYQALWKYEGLTNIPGILAGGVGYGGSPPADAETIVDRRIIDENSPIRISIENQILSIRIIYKVTIKDVFDFAPGGGGYDDDNFSLFDPKGVLVATGVSLLQSLEQLGRAADVPFETTFYYDALSESIDLRLNY
jgi:YD repeat-containing protein